MEPKPLTDWFFIILSPRVLNDDANVEKARNFVRRLVAEAAEQGITIADISETRNVVQCEYRDQTTIEGVFQKAIDVMTRDSKKLQMIMFCIPTSDEIYGHIKYCGEMVYGVRTQCVRDDHVLDTPAEYLAGLLQKVNGKLNGIHSIIPRRLAERCAHFAAH